MLYNAIWGGDWVISEVENSNKIFKKVRAPILLCPSCVSALFMEKMVAAGCGAAWPEAR